MMEFDATADPRRTARTVKSLVTPRPIAWVSSTSPAGVDNLAPFSCYNYLGSSQPVVMFNASPRDGERLKDSARNAIETEEFAVNVVTEALIEEMDHTAKDVPSAESEFDVAGLERAPCREIDPPRVADAVATMECTLYDAIEIYDRTMVIGDVVHFHLDESVATDGKADSRKLDTVGRLGGPYYTVSEPLDFERQY